MTAITIYMKLLAGDQVSLEIAPYLSFTDLYVAAFYALPEEVRPSAMYALQLFRVKEEEEEKKALALPFTDEMVELEEGEHFAVLITPATFRVELALLGEGVDIEEEEFFYEYSRYLLTVYYNERAVSQKQFYVTPFRYQEEDMDGVRLALYLRLIGSDAEISPYFQTEEGEFFRGTTDPALVSVVDIRGLVRDVVVEGVAQNDLCEALDFAWAEESGIRVEEHMNEDPADWLLDNDVIGFE